jgi:hypothetical protein
MRTGLRHVPPAAAFDVAVVEFPDLDIADLGDLAAPVFILW